MGITVAIQAFHKVFLLLQGQGLLRVNPANLTPQAVPGTAPR